MLIAIGGGQLSEADIFGSKKRPVKPAMHPVVFHGLESSHVQKSPLHAAFMMVLSSDRILVFLGFLRVELVCTGS